MSGVLPLPEARPAGSLGRAEKLSHTENTRNLNQHQGESSLICTSLNTKLEMSHLFGTSGTDRLFRCCTRGRLCGIMETRYEVLRPIQCEAFDEVQQNMTIKVRKIVDGPLPQGNLHKGHVVLSPPKNQQFFLKHYAAVRAWARYFWPMRQEATEILLTDSRSWGKRLERIRGTMVAKATEAAYTSETMYDAGLRRAQCVCSDRCTCQHCEHPPRQTNSQQRRRRRNRPSGKR